MTDGPAPLPGRSRARRVLAAAGAAVSLLALAVVGGTPAAAATDVPGSYVALTPTRVVDTTTGLAGNGRGRIAAGGGISPLIAGHAGVPSSAAAVFVTISVIAPTGSGTIVASQWGTPRPATATVSYRSGRAAADAAVVPLGSGRIRLDNVAASGGAYLRVDVSGYYLGGTASTGTPGVLHPVRPARFVDTRTGAAGNRRGAVPAHGAFTAQITGHDGVPGTAGSVAVTVTVSGETAAGTLVAYAAGAARPSPPTAWFAKGTTVSAFAVVPLSATGRIEIYNASSGSVQVAVDVAAWYPAGPALQAGALQPVAPHRVRTAYRLGGRGVVAVRVVGTGVPLARVRAVLVTVTVVSPATGGSVIAWESGTARPNISTTVFAAGQQVSDVAQVTPSATGYLDLYNAAAGVVTVAVDVQGSVPANTVAAPRASVGRYVRNLSASSDATTLRAEGAADAAAGARFVLLAIGAQTNDRTGVELSATTVTVSYPTLVAAVQGYLDGYGQAAGANSGATVAVATNNDGNFTVYPAAARGADWADKVIDALHPPAGMTVAGGNDIEPAFASTEAQAAAWESAYLAATTARLVFSGSADGCPTAPGGRGACAYGWTQPQLYALAGGTSGGRVLALPQVYYPAMAQQWAEIDAAGGGRLTFAGSLTQQASACGPDCSMTPAFGWGWLYRALTTVLVTPALPPDVDLRTDG